MKYIVQIAFNIEVEAIDHTQAKEIVNNLEIKDLEFIYVTDSFDIISIREEKE